MTKLDLNCDLGELDGSNGLQHDLEIMRYVSSINIACGYHAGDETRMAELAQASIQYNVQLGAHPGYADRANFGRVELGLSGSEIQLLVEEQIDRMILIAGHCGAHVKHVKPHGALYNRSAVDREAGMAIIGAIQNCNEKHGVDLILYTLAESPLVQLARDSNIVVWEEVFADRNFGIDRRLLPRSHPMASLDDSKAIRVRIEKWLKSGEFSVPEGGSIELHGETLCLHGDHPTAIDNARELSQLLGRTN